MPVPEHLKGKLALRPLAIVVMGVTGSGKSTIGALLADKLNWKFFDADDFHPPENKEKLTAGKPLTDEDRKPWLSNLGDLIASSIDANINIILACSALKHSYRKLYLRPRENVLFLHLKGSQELIAARLQARKGHFMNPDLLPSQFSTLEEPRDAATIDISETPEQICERICRWLNQPKA